MIICEHYKLDKPSHPAYCERDKVGVNPLYCVRHCRVAIDPKYPGAVEMIKTLTQAAAHHAMNKAKKRDKVAQDACWVICERCIHFVPDSRIGSRCEKCGCRLQLAVSWKVKHCPLKKW